MTAVMMALHRAVIATPGEKKPLRAEIPPRRNPQHDRQHCQRSECRPGQEQPQSGRGRQEEDSRQTGAGAGPYPEHFGTRQGVAGDPLDDHTGGRQHAARRGGNADTGQAQIHQFGESIAGGERPPRWATPEENRQDCQGRGANCQCKQQALRLAGARCGAGTIRQRRPFKHAKPRQQPEQKRPAQQRGRGSRGDALAAGAGGDLHQPVGQPEQDRADQRRGDQFLPQRARAAQCGKRRRRQPDKADHANLGRNAGGDPDSQRNHRETARIEWKTEVAGRRVVEPENGERAQQQGGGSEADNQRNAYGKDRPPTSAAPAIRRPR